MNDNKIIPRGFVLSMTEGAKVDWVIADIREHMDKGNLSVDYIKGLFGEAVGMAAIAFLQATGEISDIHNGKIGFPDV